MKTLLCCVAVVAVVVVSASPAIAGAINYHETFQSVGSGNFPTNGVPSPLVTANVFQGSNAPHPEWSANIMGWFDAITYAGGPSGLTLYTPWGMPNQVYTTASELTGGNSTIFDVSQNALTVSAVITVSQSEPTYVSTYFGGLVLGNAEILYRPSTIGDHTATISATIQGTNSAGYTVTYSVADPLHSVSYTGSETLTGAEVGSLSNVGIAWQLSTDVVSNFTVTQASSTPSPEPGTLVLLATGLIGLLCYAWRKRK